MTRYPKNGKGSEWTIAELNAVPKDWHGDTLSDGGGLSGEVRVGATETAIRFKYAYRWQNKVKWYQCGTYPQTNLSEIRKRRNNARELVAKGLEPTAQKKATVIALNLANQAAIDKAKKAREAQATVQDLFDAWIKDGVSRKDGNSDLRRTFEKDVLPAIGKLALKDLNEQAVLKMYRDVISRGVQRTAILLARDLAQMMRWAEKRQPWRGLLIDGNPVALVDIMKLVSHDYVHERSRVLSPSEIKELASILLTSQAEYEAAPNRRTTRRPLADESQCAIWICLSTLCRIGELLKAKWSHVDFDETTWFIPAENTKGERGKKQDQTVTLSPFALSAFTALKKLTGETVWLFPSSMDSKQPLNEKTISKQIGDRQIIFKNRKLLKNRVNDNSLVLSNGENGEWTPHDLRRTGATLMQELGVTLEVIDRCQNHVIAGSKVRRHYMKYDYRKEKAEAWLKLGQRLDLLLNHSKVALLRTA
jgi:integrase